MHSVGGDSRSPERARSHEERRTMISIERLGTVDELLDGLVDR